MKINFFNPQSPFYSNRWFIVLMIALVGSMTYCDLTGNRLFQFSNQQQWSNSGPGYHK